MVRLKQALLVAEDEEIAIELKPLLTGLGFKVTMLHDGALVTETLGDRQFEVAVVNANLPQMNWHRTAQEIKRASKTTTVIMMTRFAQEKDVRLALSAGSYAVVDRPITRVQLTNLLSQPSDGLLVVLRG